MIYLLRCSAVAKSKRLTKKKDISIISRESNPLKLMKERELDILMKMGLSKGKTEYKVSSLIVNELIETEGARGKLKPTQLTSAEIEANKNKKL